MKNKILIVLLPLMLLIIVTAAGCAPSYATSEQVAALQNPNAVVVEHAVDHDHRGLCGVECFAACVRISFIRGRVGWGEGEFHAAFSAAFSARLRSSIKSSASSKPMDKRMVPAPMPAAAKAASLMRKWVVLAG